MHVMDTNTPRHITETEAGDNLNQGCNDIGKILTLQFFLTLRYILPHEKLQEFSSDVLNHTLFYAALLLSYGQLTCTDLTSFCHSDLCGTDVNGQTF